MSNVLVPWEAEKLHQCEVVIEQGLRTFVDVGNALLTIRDKRLYRVDYGTFESYCRERWQLERAHAYRMIEAASVVENLSPVGDKLPQSERQARPLTRLEPEQQQEAWARVVAESPDGNITGAKVQEVVDRMRGIRVACSICGESYEDLGFGIGCPCCLKRSRNLHTPHVSHSSGNNEWYTPSKYIAAAYDVMGSIDLDPASSGLANETVKAETYYTAEDDGLVQEWAGRVWMNPPYASGLIEQFAEKLAKHVNAGDVIEACVLVNNATETGWFNALLDVATCVCLIKTRVKFIDIDGRPSGSPLQGQVVLYIGENETRFAVEFGHFGKVLYARQDSE